MTDWPVRYFHGHRINVQRWEDNRVARVSKVNDDGSREVLLIEPVGVAQGFRLDGQLHALADLEALPLDSWTPPPHNCEKFAPPGFLTDGYRQQGERWTCPSCGKTWVHDCDEAEGCAWFPK